MTALQIKRDDFIMALTFRMDSFDAANYLDRETGDIILVSDGVDEDMIPPDLEDNPRYLLIEPIESSDGFRIMEDFVATIDDEAVAERLASALQRPKPFRRFKDALFDDLALREAWFAFEAAAHAQLASQWCEDHEIDVEWV
ncbi:UPF0158 family protein [Piscinibacter sp.]|jgi:hypothetical protein|uniref:UPF0158 family protein n=1 Tax=Piscinibacter sp. TaxID=1903157 RepID=UPI002F40BE9C